MNFSLLPLLLLFASAICASPIHIGRRMNNEPSVPDTILTKEHELTGVYRSWHQQYQSRAVGVEGVPVAMKVTVEGPHPKLGYLMVEVEVRHQDSGTVKSMIDSLDESKNLISWKWEGVGDNVVFVIRMPLPGEGILKEHLHVLWKVDMVHLSVGQGPHR